MHTSNFKPNKLLMVDSNGNEIELQGTVEFEWLDSNSLKYNPYKDISITELSMSINITNSMVINRKRFIKLLMSKGIQRNGANEIAKYVLRHHGKYTMLDLMMW